VRCDSPPGLPEEYPVLGLAQSYAWSGQQLLSFEKVDDLFEALTSVAVKQVPGVSRCGRRPSASCWRRTGRWPWPTPERGNAVST